MTASKISLKNYQFLKILSQKDDSVISIEANSVTLSRMICDVFTLHIGCISPADQLSFFVCTGTRLNTKF